MSHRHEDEIRRLARQLLLTGTESLSEAELLGLVLHHPRLGRALVGLSPDWAEADHDLLDHLPGFTDERLAQLRALAELARRLSSKPLSLGQPLQCSDAVVSAYRPKLAAFKQEVFVVISLNNRNCVIAEHIVAKGSLDSVGIHPREVFRPLLRDAAARAIALHNHPSGDPTPSPNDTAICRRLHETGKIIGIALLDFLVVAREGSVSFRDIGLLPGT
ncbi:MAG: JAB domain-containing protein [Bacilli bacterium]|jgi:DNA repair protein RadC